MLDPIEHLAEPLQGADLTARASARSAAGSCSTSSRTSLPWVRRNTRSSSPNRRSSSAPARSGRASGRDPARRDRGGPAGNPQWRRPLVVPEPPEVAVGVLGRARRAPAVGHRRAGERGRPVHGRAPCRAARRPGRRSWGVGDMACSCLRVIGQTGPRPRDCPGHSIPRRDTPEHRPEAGAVPTTKDIIRDSLAGVQPRGLNQPLGDGLKWVAECDGFVGPKLCTPGRAPPEARRAAASEAAGRPGHGPRRGRHGPAVPDRRVCR